MAERLSIAAGVLEQRMASASEAVRQRDQLVFEAIDICGMSHRAVARAIGKTVGLVNDILTRSV